MEKIIFLDIDGVVNDNSCESFLTSCVKILNNLVVKEKAKVVLISSWQGTGTKARRKRVLEILNESGIKVDDFIDPNLEGNLGDISLPSRVIGIVDYLKKNNDCNYVILDDEFHNDYKLLCLNHFKTHMYKGLQRNDLNLIAFKSVNLSILNRVDYHYRQLGDYEKATNNLIKVLRKIAAK